VIQSGLMRTTILLISAFCLFVLSAATSSAQVVFDIDGPGSEPLDYHSEARLKRSYVENEKCPVTLDEELQVRCEYLIQKKRYDAEVRRSLRLDQRNRSLNERLEIREGDRVVPEALVFNPDGPGSEPLSPNREARISQRARGENCDESKMNTEEFERCMYLWLKMRYERGLIQMDKRSSRKSRVVNRAAARLSGRQIFFEIEEVKKSEKVDPVEFDESGPGSVPLGAADENRIYQYVNNKDCSRLSKKDMKDRCEYILKYNYYLRTSSDERMRSRTSIRVSTGDVLLRRGIQRGNIGNTTSVIRARALQGGFKPSPRTIREAEANFSAPVLVEGDDE